MAQLWREQHFALRGSAQTSGLPLGGPSSHPGVINLCQHCSYCSFTLCLVVVTFTPGFLRPNSWCPRRYPEVEFPLAKSAGAENVLLTLRAGKSSARCSGLCHSPHLPPALSRVLGCSCSRGAGEMPLNPAGSLLLGNEE